MSANVSLSPNFIPEPLASELVSTLGLARAALAWMPNAPWSSEEGPPLSDIIQRIDRVLELQKDASRIAASGS